MATNPSKQGPILNPATQRGSKLNDPNLNLQQGYSPFDLTHAEMLTPRFGEYTPSLHLDTVPADRMVINSDIKTIHNRIDGNLLSTVNQYDDTFFVSLANLIPNAYERFIPNPVKGDDLPNSALPQIPFAGFIHELLASSKEVYLRNKSDDNDVVDSYHNSILENVFHPSIGSDPGFGYGTSPVAFNYAMNYLTLVAYILSRGQLLDYLGVQYDEESVGAFSPGFTNDYNSQLQDLIDQYFVSLTSLVGYATGVSRYNFAEDAENGGLLSNNLVIDIPLGYPTSYFQTLSQVRDFIQTTFERGDMMVLRFPAEIQQGGSEAANAFSVWLIRSKRLYDALLSVFYSVALSPTTVDNVDAPYDLSHSLNPLKPLAYQLCVAQYGTNDLIDNIYTADLYMQNFRSVMFPSYNSFSSEPTYVYNGVNFEYDLMSYGAWYYSFISDVNRGSLKRAYIVATMLFVMRRSLRFGDYFSTARPNMLAVGDLYINVVGGKISPVDVTKDLLMQRYLNSANYLGQRIDSLYASVYGVVPSDRPVCPRYISHRKVTLQSQITNNTADEQGKQSTNLVGYTSEDNNLGVDVFLDDYGVIISMVSYDVLPVYTSGIDGCYAFSDRFDYYNPQLQNIGDQPIKTIELYGFPSFASRVFGYQMRNAELKYKVSRAHGGLVNDLPGFIFRYPPKFYLENNKIGPDFIRDKPMFFDQLATRMTGCSPAQYYHFVVSCVNQVHAARRMQATPPILF